MEPVHAKGKAADFSTKDFISNMPDNVIAEILERMSIQDAVRTSALSKGWRFRWNMLTKLIFDLNFIQFIIRKHSSLISWQTVINRVLLRIKYPITKFILYIPDSGEFDVVSINDWIQFLSAKGSLKEFVLVNMYPKQFTLPTHFFSCLELQHLVLHYVHLKTSDTFCGFPNLITIECSRVYFEWLIDINRSPLLEKVALWNCNGVGKCKSIPFYNRNLKTLSTSLGKGMKRTRVLSMMEAYFPRLEELNLDFTLTKLLDDQRTAALRNITTAFYCLKTLQLHGICFNDSVEVFCTFWLIRRFPNLQKLVISTAEKQGHVSPLAPSNWEEGCTMGQLHTVKLYNIKGLKNELSLIKFLLASCPLLKKMEIVHQRSSEDIGYQQSFSILKDLVKFPRASAKAEIDFN